MNSEGVQIVSTDATSYLDLLDFQREFLLHVMGEKWFRNPRPSHPAYRRWRLLSTWIDREGLIDETVSVADTVHLARILLDSCLLVALSGGDVHRRKLGDLTAYGGADMQQFIRERLPRKEFFEDVLCELSFAGYHRSLGHVVTPHQGEGLPYLRIEIPDSLLVDCKRVSTLHRNSLKGHLRTANRQVKRYNQEHGTTYPGLAVLDVSLALQNLPAVGMKPEETLAQHEVAAVQRLVGRDYSSLSAVLLLWDACQMREDGSKTWIIVRRIGVLLPHGSPLHPLPAGTVFDLFEVRQSILWYRPLSRPYTITSTVDFDRITARLGVNPNLAVQTYQQPDRIWIAYHNGSTQERFVLFVKHLHTEPVPFSLLVGAMERPGHAQFWFALPRRGTVESPRGFLENIVEEFGQLFIYGGRQVRMLWGVDAPVEASTLGKELLAVMPPGDRFPYIGICNDPSTQTSRIGVAFCLDLSRYVNWRE